MVGERSAGFAYCLGYVEEGLSWDVSLVDDDRVSLGAFSLVEGYAAFLVGDDHFGAGHAKGLVEFFHVLLPVGRGIFRTEIWSWPIARTMLSMAWAGGLSAMVVCPDSGVGWCPVLARVLFL